MEQNKDYKKGFIPYALAAFLIGIVGGFSTVLGPSFVQDIGIAYNNAVRSLLWAEFWLDIQGIPWRTDRCHHQLGRLNYPKRMQQFTQFTNLRLLSCCALPPVSQLYFSFPGFVTKEHPNEIKG